MNQPTLVIMAAGMGSRYGGLKQIDPVDPLGHIIIDYSIFDAVRAGFRDLIFVIKHEIEKDFREIMDPHLTGKDIRVRYVFQETTALPDGFTTPAGRTKPFGTAHAVLCAGEAVDAPFAVINADDYYGTHAFRKIYDFLKNAEDGERYQYAMVGYRLKNTVTAAGTVSRGICTCDGSSHLLRVKEHTKIGTESGEIFDVLETGRAPLDPDSVVSMNLWGFTPSYIRECRRRFPEFLRENLGKNPLGCEFCLPTVVSDLLEEKKAEVLVLESEDRWYGVTYKEDKAGVMRAFETLRREGVYPENF